MKAESVSVQDVQERGGESGAGASDPPLLEKETIRRPLGGGILDAIISKITCDVCSAFDETRISDERLDAPVLSKEEHESDFLDFDSLFNLALEKNGEGNVELAVSMLEECLEKNPSHIATLCELGAIHRDQGEPDTAEGYFKRIVSLDPEHFEARRKLGIFALEKGLADVAVEHLKAATEVKPKDANIWLDLGFAHMQAEQDMEAIQAFDLCLTLSPRNSMAMYNIGVLQVQQEKYLAARKHFECAVQYDSTNSDAMFNLGVLHQNFDDTETAIKWYEQAYATNPSFEQAKEAADFLKKQRALHDRQQLFKVSLQRQKSVVQRLRSKFS
eukprot:CAMPEP_0206385278 /NCGR_PEP_ID=MMETSP0294-20121207/15156_1 /ASSEMBLY_ACC=CAM_ASM_000327 /TAXON_ID=39354 /ORGANISM="Heterosigma akashiwo, Strain CCMP2393" /LENGTH=329 /DNA_ID=CAMNT_0053835911 /DNA_START=6 /DNA_END=995 /DNA_ORIENTATION=+